MANTVDGTSSRTDRAEAEPVKRKLRQKVPEEIRKEERCGKYRREFNKMEDGNRSFDIGIIRGLAV